METDRLGPLAQHELKKSRLEGYLDAGDLVLTDEDIAAIETAGAERPPAKPQR
ncbi:hypothetical protein K438DRAFT_1995611 [Mycena galopus ATCC 62051]|nr:hypothetical protein K438DRAFT_1995611 [Mycena galopus ATCC 62051]